MCAQPIPESTGKPKQQITPLQIAGLIVFGALFLWQMGILRLDSPNGLQGYIAEVGPRLVALLLAITVHEFSHGLVATWFGDPTPRLAGRLTLNPIRHLDVVGTALILLRAPIGWGKPMPINPSKMRNSNLGWALSSLAGPISNILAAGLVAVVYGQVANLLDPSFEPYVFTLIFINLLLAIFNLVPLPPLDGFGVVFGLAPRAIKVALLPLMRMGPLLLMAVLFLPPLSRLLNVFMLSGLRILLPPIEAACQCRLLG